MACESELMDAERADGAACVELAAAEAAWDAAAGHAAAVEAVQAAVQVCGDLGPAA